MPTATDSSTTSVDIVVVCAIGEELDAFKNASGTQWKTVPITNNDGYPYEVASIQTLTGDTVRIVCAVAPQMGLTPSAVLTTKMILRFRPSLVAMLGVAAGVVKDGRHLGDILVPDTTFDYESGKLTRHDDGTVEFLRGPNPLDVNSALVTRVKAHGTREVLDRIARSYAGPPPTTLLSLHVGPVGSGAIVVDDAAKMDAIQQFSRKLVGVEMELYAVHRACKESCTRSPLFLGMKSIMDFAQNKKDDAKHYAAYTSSAFFVDFIKASWNLIPTAARPDRRQTGSHLNDVIRLGVESLQQLLEPRATINGRYFALDTKDGARILRRMDHLHVEGAIMTGEQGLDFAYIDTDELGICEAFKAKQTQFKRLVPPEQRKYSPRIAKQIDSRQKWAWCTPVYSESRPIGVLCFFSRDDITTADERLEAFADVLVVCARALASGLEAEF